MTGHDLYNALREASIAQHAKPPELEDIDPRALSPFQRALVAIDGTVTTFLQAYTLEHIAVRRISQQSVALAGEDRWLEAPAGTKVVRREVVIEGSSSHTLYLYACSQIVIGRLPKAVRLGLEVEGEGLGRLLNADRMETRRELLWYGSEHAPDLPKQLRERTGPDFFTRAYRIISGGKPIMMMTERIPADLEPAPATS